MKVFYCETCQSIILLAGEQQPTQHQHTADRWFPITFVGYYHPDFKLSEIQKEVYAQRRTP